MLIISLEHARKLGLVVLVAISTLSTLTNSAPITKRTPAETSIINANSASIDITPQAQAPQPALFDTFKTTRRALDDDQEEEDEFDPLEDEEEEGEREAGPIWVSKAKQPDTPPKSLPSDPFAHYTYEKPYTPAPGSLKPGQKARKTYVVGDVHGSLAGLNNFLKKVSFDAAQDEIIFAGDMVAKGPQSLEVIDKAIELKARCVRGNHDDKVLRWKSYLDSLNPRQKIALDLDSMMRPKVRSEDEDGPEYDAEAPEISPRAQKRSIPGDLVENSEHHEIAKKMTKAQYNYLVSCPLILTIPKELAARKIPIHVVHAGIDPSDKLSKQLPWVLVNVRNILKDGTPSRKKKKGESWAQQFNDFHSKRVKQGEPDFLMLYGHDAGRALNQKKWSIGLDTGCVYGRQLSTYIVETGEVKSFACPDLGLGDDED
ncbi:hypothetical protein BGZ95_009315 [Linnemannia exigua]|uniref:Calcineurin-like phosphoesterase domain-containing protein n=1 Tax=Linnemannia exigua TaxID=604196 RepID=A0AAD4DD09_9FUNG|nr:hypothetical protein BGZ95_009315 [Linnemannia exigua]